MLRYSYFAVYSVILPLLSFSLCCGSTYRISPVFIVAQCLPASIPILCLLPHQQSRNCACASKCSHVNTIFDACDSLFSKILIGYRQPCHWLPVKLSVATGDKEMEFSLDRSEDVKGYQWERQHAALE